MKTLQLLTVVSLLGSATARADVSSPLAPTEPLVRIEAESEHCSVLPEVLRWWAEPLRPLTTIRDGVGFVARADGVVAAPADLIHGADRITVALPDGRRLRADVVSIHSSTRTALLRVAATHLQPATLKPAGSLSFGADLRIGKRSLTYVGASQGSLLGLASSGEAVEPGAPLMNPAGAIVGLHPTLLTIPVPAPLGGVIHLVHAQPATSLARAIAAVPAAPRLEVDHLLRPSWDLLGWPLRLDGELDRTPSCEPVPLD